MNSQPIFILGAHKSGTSLLRSILDGHSALYAIPIESHFFEAAGHWIRNEYRKQRPQQLAKEALIDNFCRRIHTSNTGDKSYTDSLSEGLLNEEKFRDHFSTHLTAGSDASLMASYFSAIHYSVEGTELPEHIRVVEKSVENAEFVSELTNMYPKARFLHIIRNPYANFVSLRKFKSIDFGYPVVKRLVKTLRQSYYYAYKLSAYHNRYRLIQYEHLVTNPEKVVRGLCEFLELEFEDVLLKPTYRGEPWQGNSSRDLKFQNISSKNLDLWQNDIHTMEIYYVNRLFAFILDDFRYSRIEKKGSFWLPAKGENFQRYLANRIYRYLLFD